MNYKILLDTDIGDDIDDSFALALAAKSDEFDVVAVTTVFRNTLCRARQCAKLLDVLGKDVPVYAGESLPMDGVIPSFAHDNGGDMTKTVPCQYDESMDGYATNDNAVQAIVDFADKYAGEAVVVTIGAITNLARALELRPDIAGKIKKVVMMGGWFGNFAPEWNILCDPVAVKKVYDSGIEVYATGLDVTLQCVLDDKLLDDFRASRDPSNKLIVSWMDKWFATFNFEKSVMHDPLAVATLIDDTVCNFETKYCRVVTSGDKKGAIEVSDVAKAGFVPVHVATSVDKDKFYGIVRKRMLNA